jgi:hypothetical protein
MEGMQLNSEDQRDEKDTRICFQTTSEISNTLDSIAEDEKLSVPEVVDAIINRYLKEDKESQGPKKNHRRFERKKVDLLAHIGDPQWQRCDFEEIKIMDISIGGIRFAAPKGTKLEIMNDSVPNKLNIIFHLPNNHWPINMQISPQRVSESRNEVQVGAALVNPDYHAYSALQKYLM